MRFLAWSWPYRACRLDLVQRVAVFQLRKYSILSQLCLVINDIMISAPVFLAAQL